MDHYSYADIDRSILYRIAELYLAGVRPRELAEILRDEYGMKNITPQRIHDPLLVMIRREGIIQIVPQPEVTLQEELALRYQKDVESLHVVNARGALARQAVCRRAAYLTLGLIKKLARTKDIVRVGLGGGVTMLETASELAHLLHGEPLLPPIAFHALTSGVDVHNPISSPSAFLTYFMDLPMPVELVGLQGPAIVDTKMWGAVKKWPGMVEPFTYKNEIDIIVTGIATSEDEHGALRGFAKVGEDKGFEIGPLEDAGWHGDLFYEAFGEKAPLPLKINGCMRAVTMFGLAELRKIALDPNRHVVVVAAPCSGCGTTKTRALRPLLQSDRLAVWNHLVLDVATAKELLPPPPVVV